MSNWKIQIKAFVKPGALKVALYHGPKREEVLKKVKRNEIDVLITSYGTLVSDVNKHEEFLAEKEEEEEERKPKAKKARGNEMQQAWHGHDEDDWEPMEEDSDDEDHHLPASMLKKRGRETFPKHWIFDLHFHRIVLDEAHNIRNSDTGMFKSTSRLSSEYKCATTATPFVNRPSDIHSLLAFLKADPLSDKKLFANFVMKPIMSHNLIGLSRIRTMMGQVALRRNKVRCISTSYHLVLPSRWYCLFVSHSHLLHYFLGTCRIHHQACAERSDDSHAQMV
jgi:SWI/SNF-related matrix-associated actin-dependent regulator of chromatin subfamily A3